jgi:hypothetical protein
MEKGEKRKDIKERREGGMGEWGKEGRREARKDEGRKEGRKKGS